jgi:hypothetical protein
MFRTSIHEEQECRMSQDRNASFRDLMENAKSERIAYLAQLLCSSAAHLVRVPASVAASAGQVIAAIRLASYVPRRH